MKTLTLRLTDNEAEALDRMAAVYDMSKNKLLTALIIDGYDNMTCFRKKPDPEENTLFLYCFPDTDEFVERMFSEYAKAYENGTELPITAKECAKRVLRAYDYALATLTDPAKIKHMEKRRANTLEEDIIIDPLTT